MTPTEIFLDPKEHNWITEPAVTALFEVMAAGGAEIRIVGGAVRDAMLGRSVGDIDLAVNIRPEKVMYLLNQAGIKTVPTGLKFGTITAVIDRKGYEITTLRHDLDPDGRWAKVEFTSDWQADAARRDFTINALYLDKNYRVYDFFDGRTDLQARLIRFIGDPYERIAEDHLRILRAFRFMAEIEGARIDQGSLQACFELSRLIPNLSAERVWKEHSRLLAARNPVPAVELMIQGNVMVHFTPELTSIDRLKRLVMLEPSDSKPCPLRRLAALMNGGAKEFAKRLKLSRAQSDKLQALEASLNSGNDYSSAHSVRQKLYDLGPDIVRDVLLLLVANGEPTTLLEHMPVVNGWIRPVFPLKGRDLRLLGLAEGADIGRALDAVAQWWRQHDFEPDKDACTKYFREQHGVIG